MNMPFQPVIPFEPISAAGEIPVDGKWIAQIKWDGVRVLTYYDGTAVRLFNRKKHERTLQYPELLDIADYCNAASVILDGEIIAFEAGKPSFHEVMRRDGLRSAEKVRAAQGRVPITYMIFDVLYCNGEWVMAKPLRERLDLLTSIIKPNEKVQLVQSFDNPEQLFEAARAQGLEGIVCKDLDSSYAADGKDKRWLKKKNYQDLVAVIGGVTFSHQTVNALLLGIYDEQGKLIYIGHAGAGKLTRKDWTDLTAFVRPMITEQMPFVNRPDRHKDAVWLKPLLTVKVQFLEWTSYGTMRQPGIQALTAVPPGECTLSRELPILEG